ncbi:hypothetical protein HG535_0E03210 [Zygotorulaspora mrakii]|uniref:VPS10 domain-containing protein n=1 Tax=Zygotorulaspora mrakii TaxID=42260 RepID=A0A7H9B403_ZYGMR|nr:uncharacterized protein HG535_0E03210 [Zygotorulaspora mrakii]QLG73237.1 hypothetical protein HG535_0E03210 [Zygotorulaspora mrakii]
MARFFQWICIIGVLLFRRASCSDEFAPKVSATKTSGTFQVAAFDDSTTLLLVSENKLKISWNNGENWENAEQVDQKVEWVTVDSFYAHDRAFVSIKNQGKVYMTNDQGKSWSLLELDGGENNDYGTCLVQSHPRNRDYIIAECRTSHIEDGFLVSNDSGKNFRLIETPVEGPSRSNANVTIDVRCEFGEISPESSLFDNDPIVYCLTAYYERNEKYETTKATSVLYYTDDFGKSVKKFEQFEDKAVRGFKLLNSYLIISIADDKFNEASAISYWISTDGKFFNKAYLPTVARNDRRHSAYEDMAGRIILPISASGDQDSGATILILRSDSTGLIFEVVPWGSFKNERAAFFELSTTLPGTIVAQSRSFFRNRRTRDQIEPTKITADNGLTWQNLRVVDPDMNDTYSCDINDFENCFLSPLFVEGVLQNPTPGILMLLGEVTDGDVKELSDMMTFISVDGGSTWRFALEYPAAYAFGDYGNIIVAIPYNPEEDNDPLAEFYYSLDHGRTWTEYQLEEEIMALEVRSTTPDGSGSKFILNGLTLSRSDTFTNYIYTIDFSEAFDGKACSDDDFETWQLAGGKCINGAKISMQKRKQDASCLVKTEFKNLETQSEPCEECTNDDYECSPGFSRNEIGECVPDYNLLSYSETCLKSKTQQTKLDPIKKIKNNRCKKELSIEPVTVSCKELSDPNEGEIMVTENEFTSELKFYEYFDTVEDESLIMATDEGIYISHDSAQNIRKFNVDDRIIEVVFNPFFNSSAYLFGKSGSLYITNDRGSSFYVTKLPETKQLGFPLEFNAKEKNTFIYYGGEDCNSMFDQNCHAVAYITRDGGETFIKLLDNAIHCEFVGSTFPYPVDENLIICQVKEKQSQQRSLVSSKDFFQNEKTIVFESIIGYMSTGDFLVVAIPHSATELRAYVTVDGKEFAEAKFPQEYLSEEQESFTVLGSQTGAIFVHVSTSDKPGAEYGVLMKSNSNGTSFVALETAVNSNRFGMVDFEKVEGLEGIILINTVANPEKAADESEGKHLKSKITFNDGSDWSYLQPPSRDSEGQRYPCQRDSIDKCSLHLHSYTEREDLRDTFSSGSAFGMLIGVGNVGEYLLPEDACSTFFSTDGGETWTELKKESTRWEYGDHGGVIVLVPKKVQTDTITYSTDSGKTWQDFKFTADKTIVNDIITVPRDSALRFILVSESTSIKGASTRTFSINFYNAFDGQCVFSPQDPGNDDFEYFSLGKTKEQCLFGHQTNYLKKIRDDCFVGNVPLTEFSQITENCTCTRQDFECDYNYYKAMDGTCKLVQGLTPADPSEICKKEGMVEFFKPSGYRKIPLSTCQGGLKLDEVSDPYPCPGMEEEFNKKYGVKGRSFFLIFIILLVVFALIAWFVYERGIRRNGGFSRFGEIRLNENELIEDTTTDKIVNKIVKSGLFAVSGLFAAYQLVKRSLGNVFSRFGERMRGRTGPSYSSLVHDQFLDEADDLLAGHDEDANDLGDFMENEGNFEIEDDDALSIPDQINLGNSEEAAIDNDRSPK